MLDVAKVNTNNDLENDKKFELNNITFPVAFSNNNSNIEQIKLDNVNQYSEIEKKISDIKNGKLKSSKKKKEKTENPSNSETNDTKEKKKKKIEKPASNSKTNGIKEKKKVFGTSPKKHSSAHKIKQINSDKASSSDTKFDLNNIKINEMMRFNK